MVLIVISIFVCGARRQHNRYIKRQRDFDKIFKYFNRKSFAKRGVYFSAGLYGAYIKIRLKLSEAEKAALKSLTEAEDALSSFPRRSEFSKSLLLDSLDDSRGTTLQNLDVPKNLIDDFLQRDFWNEEAARDPALIQKINDLLIKEEEDLEWGEGDKNETTGAELIEKEKQRLYGQQPSRNTVYQSETSIAPSKYKDHFPKDREILEASPSSMTPAKYQRFGSAAMDSLPLTNKLQEVKSSHKPSYDCDASMSKVSDLKESLLNDDTDSDFHTVLEYEPGSTTKSIRHRDTHFGLKSKIEVILPRVTERPNEETTVIQDEEMPYPRSLHHKSHQYEPSYKDKSIDKPDLQTQDATALETEQNNSVDLDEMEFYSAADFNTVENMSVAPRDFVKKP